MIEKDLLRAIYSTSLRSGRSTENSVAAELEEEENSVEQAIGRTIEAGLAESDGAGGVRLTEKGRGNLRVVMMGGAFEIIHPGHVYTLAEAKKYGDTLVVVVAMDSSVMKNKGRQPVTSQEMRVKLVSSLRMVDVALPGEKGSIFEILLKIRPDVVALGYDQIHNSAEVEAEAKRRGLDLRVVRLDTPIPGIKTSKILQSM